MGHKTSRQSARLGTGYTFAETFLPSSSFCYLYDFKVSEFEIVEWEVKIRKSEVLMGSSKVIWFICIHIDIMLSLKKIKLRCFSIVGVRLFMLVFVSEDDTSLMKWKNLTFVVDRKKCICLNCLHLFSLR